MTKYTPEQLEAAWTHQLLRLGRTQAEKVRDSDLCVGGKAGMILGFLEGMACMFLSIAEQQNGQHEARRLVDVANRAVDAALPPLLALAELDAPDPLRN